MQYVSIKFRPSDKRSYTYQNPFEPVKVGDTVEIETREGPFNFKVLAITDQKPEFATKPITRIV